MLFYNERKWTVMLYKSTPDNRKELLFYGVFYGDEYSNPLWNKTYIL